VKAKCFAQQRPECPERAMNDPSAYFLGLMLALTDGEEALQLVKEPPRGIRKS